MNSTNALTMFAGWLLAFCIVPLASAENAAVVGAILPLTGDSAFWGENPQKAIELALEDLASQEQITNVRFVFEDDRCNARDAVAAFHKLVNVDKVKIILGPSCSSAAAALAPLAEQAKVLLVPFAESADLKTGPHVIRLWVPNDLQGERVAEYTRRRINYGISFTLGEASTLQ